MKKEEEHEERDIELVNIVGNLMIAEYQVDKLRSRVSEKIGGKYIYESEAGKKVYNNDWWNYSFVVCLVVLVFFFPVLGSIPCLRSTDAT